MHVLSTLAHRADMQAYEVLKAYAASPDPGLETIASIALGECELFLNSSICGDDNSDVVFTGIGPAKNMLRYFFMVLPVNESFNSLDRSVIESMFHQRAEELQCIIEETIHDECYTSCTLIMPLTVSVAQMIEPVLERCVEVNVSVNPDYYCGGWIPDKKEIKDILAVMHGEKEPDEPYTTYSDEEPF